MIELVERIKRDGRVLGGGAAGILKVDSFLNHQVDMELMARIGERFAEAFALARPDKVLTIESSGIASAGMAALRLSVPLIIMKKQASVTSDGERFCQPVRSFTKGVTYELSVSKAFLKPGEKVLFIDDFLAMGEAALGASRIIAEAKAELVGIGIVIEKSFQPGRAKLEALGVPIVSLARISKIPDGATDCHALEFTT